MEKHTLPVYKFNASCNNLRWRDDDSLTVCIITCSVRWENGLQTCHVSNRHQQPFKIINNLYSYANTIQMLERNINCLRFCTYWTFFGTNIKQPHLAIRNHHTTTQSLLDARTGSYWATNKRNESAANIVIRK